MFNTRVHHDGSTPTFITAVHARVLLMALLAFPTILLAQPRQNASTDEYTRYELLDPASAKFAIVYDVTAVTPGARFFFNPIRKGSEASDESVIDAASGRPLQFEVVTGAQAREAGFTRADLDTNYIKVTLARPVPQNGQQRIRILKTYRDAKSYYTEGDLIVFARPLGIRRNAIVLPRGYEIVSCTVPVQVIEEPDGRLNASFIHSFPGEADVVLKARRVQGPESKVQGPQSKVQSPITRTSDPRPTLDPGKQTRDPGPRTQASRPNPALRDVRVSERAKQDRDIVYFLQPPETHAFRLYHDYTEARPGVDAYYNVVRAGSTVSNPSAYVLDTGDVLKTEIVKGSQLIAAKADIGEPVEPDSEVVIIRFPAVQKNTSVRLRIEETYSDPNRYGLVRDQLVWHRAFGRPRNAILLPEGWYLTTSSVPATISEENGKIRLDFVNPRNDDIDTYVKARRR